MTDTAQPRLAPGLACLSMLAKFFEKAGDYEQLRHAHGDPARPADEVDLLRYANHRLQIREASPHATAVSRSPPGQLLVNRPGFAGGPNF